MQRSRGDENQAGDTAVLHGTGVNHDSSFPFPPSQNPSIVLGARRELKARGSCAKPCALRRCLIPAALAGEPSGELRRRLSSFPEVQQSSYWPHRHAGLPVSKQGEVGCAHSRDSQPLQHFVQHTASLSASPDPSNSPGA